MRLSLTVSVLALFAAACAQDEEPQPLSPIIVTQPAEAPVETIPKCGNLGGYQAEGRICEGPNGPEVFGDGLGMW